LLGFARLSRAQIDAFLDGDLAAGAETPAFAIGKLEQDSSALGRRYADVGVDVEADGERQAAAPCLRYGREAVAARQHQALRRERQHALDDESVLRRIGIVTGGDRPALRGLHPVRVDLVRAAEKARAQQAARNAGLDEERRREVC